MNRIFPVILGFALFFGAGSAQATSASQHLLMPFADRAIVFAAGDEPRQRARMPMQMVMAQLEASTGGRVVGAKQVIDRSGVPVYEVKLLMPNGVVRVLRVDPETGAPL